MNDFGPPLCACSKTFDECNSIQGAPDAPMDGSERDDVMRQFETGATRNADVDPDIYGFTSPLALGAFAEYMHENRVQADGTLRDSDNWKKGIPLDSYIRSMRRHMQDLTLHHDGYEELAREDLLNALGGLFFNVQGYLHETIKKGLSVARDERMKEAILRFYQGFGPSDEPLTITADEAEEESA